jgi:3-hydroxyacyl-CoA dehydrogenase
MNKRIRTAGVIGAGVMGAAIAAQMANVGIEVILLDIVPSELTKDDERKGYTEESKEFRNKFTKNGLDTALKSKPASFYLPENSKLITIGNMEDDIGLLENVDWVIEVVVERLDIKKSVFEKIETVMSPATIITSNTSGILAQALCEGRAEDFRKRFAITHFFNPPRYMKLMEIVPGPDTLPEVLEILAETSERVLGKGVVFAKDTPNFVANRIGVFSVLHVIRTMLELGLTIEAVDKLTGPVIGHPKSATFRTADLVGLDTLVHVADNVYNGAPTDEKREMFKVPDLVSRMIQNKLLGEKTKQGFYKKTRDNEGNRVILSLDYNALQFGPQEKVKLASLEMAKTISGTAQKIKSLIHLSHFNGDPDLLSQPDSRDC